MEVASKSTVKCNKSGRCAGDWCLGLAVFVTDPAVEFDEDDDAMGWRRGTNKICITHLKDMTGSLIVPPPVEVPSSLAQEFAGDRISRTMANEPVVEPNNGVRSKIVTWQMLAEAHAKGDANLLAHLARQLKTENETLVRRVIDAQGHLLDRLLDHV